jgi:Beta-galactosidase
MKNWSLLRKIITVTLAVIAALVLLILILFYLGRPQKDITWGITFSTIRAKELGFDRQQLFTTIASDLHPKIVRLPVYWSELEPQQGQFDFQTTDALLAKADEQHIRVILGLGKKQARWPECHQPDWYNHLNEEQQDQATVSMIESAVTHLRSHQSIASWQIENEPYFQYGPSCPQTSAALYEQELKAVKQLDSRPTIATDSGEKGAWITVSGSGADILGSTMYREAYYEKQGKYVTYPLPWWTYNIKAGLVILLTGVHKVIGVELQAEPWLIISNPTVTAPEEQLKHMNPAIFQQNIDYATKVGFSENYLWGAEWWYWMQREHHDSSMVDAAKSLFNNR